MKDFKQDENLKALFEDLSKPEQQQIINNYQQDMTEYRKEVELLIEDEEKKKEFIKEFFDLRHIEKVESEDYYLLHARNTLRILWLATPLVLAVRWKCSGVFE